MTDVHTFNAKAEWETVQAEIDANDGRVTFIIPWEKTGVFEGINSGDDAVIESVDGSAWIATVEDTEHEGAGFPLLVMLSVR